MLCSLLDNMGGMEYILVSNCIQLCTKCKFKFKFKFLFLNNNQYNTIINKFTIT